MEATRGILLCLLAAIAAASGKALIQECDAGPDFWCQDLQNAIQCGAVEHCIAKVWTNGADTCFQCKKIVNLIIGLANSSSLQKRVKMFLRSQCDQYPLILIRDQCMQLVNIYEGALMHILMQVFDPNVVCWKLKLCTRENSNDWKPEVPPDPPLLEKAVTAIQENIQTMHSKMTMDMNQDLPIPKPMCWMCKSFISKIQKAVPKSLIAKSTSELCLALPRAFSGACQCIVEKYVVILLNTLLGEMVPRLLCGLVLLCATEENCMEDPHYKDVTCETCLAITTMVKPLVNESVTQEQISNTLSGLCPETQVWTECHIFLQNHQARLAQLLVKPWDHRRICQEIEACPAPSKDMEDSGCASGPSYWCQSLDHAKECNATEHCLEKVWK